MQTLTTERRFRGRPTPWAARRGFSMIELLAVTALLVVITVTLADLFASSEASALRGIGHTRTEAAARAALTMLTRDLEGAVADRYFTFRLRDDTRAYGLNNSRLDFVVLQTPENDGDRDAHLVTYRVEPVIDTEGGTTLTQRCDLIRYRSPVAIGAATGSSDNAYWSDTWSLDADPDNGALLLRNVAFFHVEADEKPGYDAHDPDNSNVPPAFLDIYLEVLDRRDAGQVANMVRGGADSTNVTAFIEDRVRRYAARAIPIQRERYRPQ